jgi:DNA-binding GntR family transcriptional regulator
VQQLDLVHRSMALLASTSLAAEGRGAAALDEHGAIVEAIARGDGEAAAQALKAHISRAFETRLKLESGDRRRLEADPGSFRRASHPDQPSARAGCGALS